MGFRPTPELRGELENAAAASGLSMTQEIERRLERSFAEEPWSEPARLLMRLLGTAMSMVEQQTGKDATDYETYLAVQAAIDGVLNSLMPRMPDGLREQTEEQREKYPISGLLDPDAPIGPKFKAMFTGVAISELVVKRVRELAASARNTKTAAATPRKTD